MSRRKALKELFAALQVEAEKATLALEIGGTYFYSDFGAERGCMVKVLAASTKTNGSGWNSTVQVEILEPIGFIRPWDVAHYAVGKALTVNAQNLYAQREMAGRK